MIKDKSIVGMYLIVTVIYLYIELKENIVRNILMVVICGLINITIYMFIQFIANQLLKPNVFIKNSKDFRTESSLIILKLISGFILFFLVIIIIFILAIKEYILILSISVMYTSFVILRKSIKQLSIRR